MAIEGNLETFNLPEILQMISSQDKTGILTVQGVNDIVAISFKVGQVVGAVALNLTVEEGLGQVLASQGMVSPGDFAEVTEEHERTGKRLLDLLTEQGLLDRSSLLEALRLQTYRLMLQLLRWDQGEFKFYSGDEVAYEEGFYAISVEELLIRSVSDLGEEQGAELPEPEGVYERVPGAAEIKVQGVDGEGPSPGDPAVWLDSEEKRLWDSLDGERSAESLAEEIDLGRYKVLFTLYRLLSEGAVRPKAVPAKDRAEERKEVPRDIPEAPPEAAPPMEAPPAIEPEEPAESLEIPMEEALEEGEEEPVARRPSLDLDWIGELVPSASAAVVAILLGALPFAASVSGLLLPFPWQSDTRQTLEANRTLARYQRIDRAARTFFLLEGHYPDALSELVDLRLLAVRDLHDPRGRVLSYSSDDVSYLLQPVEEGRPVDEVPVRESITGDFLLDPDFLEVPDREAPPLVLLD
ncbi:MAG: DUF4388 domain-containing protein [Thermoanaerobaculia bacterium]|nr:DUF4388 domain-containing protein [Thermoanaerobaculia bacterium]